MDFVESPQRQVGDEALRVSVEAVKEAIKRERDGRVLRSGSDDGLKEALRGDGCAILRLPSGYDSVPFEELIRFFRLPMEEKQLVLSHVVGNPQQSSTEDSCGLTPQRPTAGRPASSTARPTPKRTLCTTFPSGGALFQDRGCDGAQTVEFSLHSRERRAISARFLIETLETTERVHARAGTRGSRCVVHR